MALSATEAWTQGFVFDDGELAHTEDTVGSALWSGFLRDTDGRLVTEAATGTYRDGFLRTASGALAVPDTASTPPLYPFKSLIPADKLEAATVLQSDTSLVSGGVPA